MEQPVFKRVLLKISGEALAGDKHFGLDFQVMGRVADVIKQCVDMGRWVSSSAAAISGAA
jgi:uridylate kinase